MKRRNQKQPATFHFVDGSRFWQVSSGLTPVAQQHTCCLASLLSCFWEASQCCNAHWLFWLSQPQTSYTEHFLLTFLTSLHRLALESSDCITVAAFCPHCWLRLCWLKPFDCRGLTWLVLNHVITGFPERAINNPTEGGFYHIRPVILAVDYILWLHCRVSICSS